MKIFQSLVDIYLNHFQQHGESSLPFLIEGNCSSQVLLGLYKNLPPIEEMPRHEKEEMWKFVKSLYPNETIAYRIRSAKIIYTIGTLI